MITRWMKDFAKKFKMPLFVIWVSFLSNWKLVRLLEKMGFLVKYLISSSSLLIYISTYWATPIEQCKINDWVLLLKKCFLKSVRGYIYIFFCPYWHPSRPGRMTFICSVLLTQVKAVSRLKVTPNNSKILCCLLAKCAWDWTSWLIPNSGEILSTNYYHRFVIKIAFSCNNQMQLRVWGCCELSMGLSEGEDC